LLHLRLPAVVAVASSQRIFLLALPSTSNDAPVIPVLRNVAKADG
jgi:hypothetical protein